MESDPEDRPPATYPPGFEPPTDVNVPWYAWLFWPLGLLTAFYLVSLLFRGCMGALA
jgi:hypothetical protein